MKAHIIAPVRFDRDPERMRRRREMQSDKDKLEEVTKITDRIQSGQSPPDDFPRVNAYVCDKCGYVVHTVDVADGNTPLAIPCLSADATNIIGMDGKKTHHCSGAMSSAWYSVMPGDVDLKDISYEWKSPSIAFYQKLRKNKPSLADHAAKGGLLLHKRVDRDGPVITHGKFYVKPDGTRLSEREEEGRVSALEKLKAFIKQELSSARKKSKAKADLDKSKKSKDKARAKAARKRAKQSRKRNRKK